MVPTHFICNICNNESKVEVKKRMNYTCNQCKQHYELVPTKYGVALVLVGKRKQLNNEEGKDCDE
ncbi:hypothetical protein [uncultured Tissierella sp.]|uniref:hypothetical protein n=1 Tax=uncultured Tissierella sp. TaxID=448160 RepID=UPI002805855B|nr:hypothetical protein [uncultured Tissierella sp.]MDU5080259.1 hypothetical protein [Bacillota bacterium]